MTTGTDIIEARINVENAESYIYLDEETSLAIRVQAWKRMAEFIDEAHAELHEPSEDDLRENTLTLIRKLEEAKKYADTVYWLTHKEGEEEE